MKIFKGYSERFICKFETTFENAWNFNFIGDQKYLVFTDGTERPPMLNRDMQMFLILGDEGHSIRFPDECWMSENCVIIKHI